MGHLQATYKYLNKAEAQGGEHDEERDDEYIDLGRVMGWRHTDPGCGPSIWWLQFGGSLLGPVCIDPSLLVRLREGMLPHRPRVRHCPLPVRRGKLENLLWKFTTMKQRFSRYIEITSYGIGSNIPISYYIIETGIQMLKQYTYKICLPYCQMNVDLTLTGFVPGTLGLHSCCCKEHALL